MVKRFSQTIEINGSVQAGFDSVQQLFKHNMNTLAEEHAQLCVYVGQEQVVDLWATPIDKPSFHPDSLINIFSSGKSFEAIALASLVANGSLDYNARICNYWPEFAAHDKGTLTVAELMRHEAGLAAFDQSLDSEDLLTQNIKRNNVGRVIEAQQQRFRRGDNNQREYHAVTRGWIANELFRRVDAQQRTIGEYLRDEIYAPLAADVFVGVPEAELSRRTPIAPIGLGYHLMQSFKPRFLKRRVQDNFFQLMAKFYRLRTVVGNNTIAKAPPPIKGMKVESFNEAAVAQGETPSANTHATARGLAKVAAMMANQGKWEGREILPFPAWQALHAAPQEADMGITTNFTQGGVALFSPPPAGSSRLDRALNEGREGFYGWMGLGGSVFQWHPAKQIGFAFVPSSLHVLDLVNERAKAYQAEVLRCLG